MSDTNEHQKSYRAQDIPILSKAAADWIAKNPSPVVQLPETSLANIAANRWWRFVSNGKATISIAQRFLGVG